MTENDIRSEWEKHSGDKLSKEELDKAFVKFSASIDAMESSNTKALRPLFLRRLRSISIVAAAAVVAVVLIPWLTLKLSDKGVAPSGSTADVPQFCEVSTHNGETKELFLPDGTTVKLNAGSVLVYPERFSSAERSVYISGEAIFRVAHNPSVPFVVGTSDMNITVHGTVFNVRSYPGDRNISATLCEGSISAYVKEEDRTVLMTPDYRISYDRTTGSSSLTKVNAEEDTAWERGDLCFRSETIHDIAKSLERMYGINVYVTSGKYDDVVLTAKFVHGETLRQMLDAVCRLVPGMRYRIENSNIYIR